MSFSYWIVLLTHLLECFADGFVIFDSLFLIVFRNEFIKNLKEADPDSAKDLVKVSSLSPNFVLFCIVNLFLF